MSACQNCQDTERRVDLASLVMMLDYAAAEARALGVEDAARHIAYAAMLMTVPPRPDLGLAMIETQGRA